MEMNKLPEEDPDFNFVAHNMPPARELVKNAIETAAQVITFHAKAKAATELSTRVKPNSVLEKFELSDIRAMEDEDLAMVREWARMGYSSMCCNMYRVLAINKLISDFRVQNEGAEPQEGIGVAGEPLGELQVHAMKNYHHLIESSVEAIILSEDVGVESITDLPDDDTDFSTLGEEKVAAAKALISLAISVIGYDKQSSELWYRMSKGETAKDSDDDESEKWKTG